jgi:hypothetical protein
MSWPGRLLLAGTLLVCACTPPTTPSGAPTAASTTAPARTQSSPAPGAASAVASPSPNSETQAAVDAAVRDAASHLGVASTDLKVVQAEPREWSDASLGCPQPGVMYAQVVTPGYLVVLSGGGKQLEYHTDERGRVVLCSER